MNDTNPPEKEARTHKKVQKQTAQATKNSSAKLNFKEKIAKKKSPQREVVRSSAGAYVVYPPPPFWGSFA